MQQNRHAGKPEIDIIVRSLAMKLPPRFLTPAHEHGWAQLIYATSGVMSVHTGRGAWVVPSQRAVWVPPGVKHTIETSGTVTLRTLFLESRLISSLPNCCFVLPVSMLLREIVLHIFRISFLYATEPSQARIAWVLVDQLNSTDVVPLDLQMPIDPRARRVAEKLCEKPETAASLAELARESGASSRTLERLFQQDVGMTFGRWRQQVRLLRALRLLAEGYSVSSVALEVGYESTSAFIAMFKRRLGKTPRRYYEPD